MTSPPGQVDNESGGSDSSEKRRGGAASHHLLQRSPTRQGHGDSSPSSSPVSGGGKHERGELPSDTLFGQGSVSYAGEFGAAPGRKRSRSLESHADAAEKFAGGSIGNLKDAGGEADGAWPRIERIGGGRLSLSDLRKIFSDQVAPAQLEPGGQHSKRILPGLEDGSHMGGLTRRSTPATTHVSGDAPVSYGRAVNIRVIGQYCKEYLVCNRGSSSDERARASSGKAAAFQKDDESLSIGARVAREAHIPHLSRTHPGTAADDWIIGKPDTLDAAVLAICLGTVCCSRVGELAGLQICNMAWGIDQAFGLEYVEGAGCRVRKRTNDTGRWGLCTRVPGGI